MSDDTRLELRLPAQLLPVLERAAGELGQSVNEFAVATLAAAAEEVMEQARGTALSNRDRDRFLALLAHENAGPNTALVEAAQRYSSRLRPPKG
jgi:uncharacterized protein (DUF1778 family)